MFEYLSIIAAIIVFIAIAYNIFKYPSYLIKPSFIFIIFFFLQLQLASAINASSIYNQLENPWVYFMLVQFFPLACLVISLKFNNGIANEIFGHVKKTSEKLELKVAVKIALALIVVTYVCVGIYLSVVPFNRTGFYALYFDPEKIDVYRQISFTLVDNQLVKYMLAFLEKALLPIAAALCVYIFIQSFRLKRYYLTIGAIIAMVLVLWPSMLYGARGPAAMVILAGVYAWFIVFKQKLKVSIAVTSIIIVLAPPIAILLFKSPVITPQSVAFETLNILDRAVGRGYIDNVWNLQFVEKNGHTGFSGIEKIARLFNMQSVNVFNEVSKENKETHVGFGISGLELDDPYKSVKKDPKKNAKFENTEVAITEELKAKAKESGSANAAFVIMNYVMFGYAGLIFSFLFVYALDLILYAYRYFSPSIIFVSISASIIPLLSLSFSLFTTVLVSKGLLVILLVSYFLGNIVDRLKTKEIII